MTIPTLLALIAVAAPGATSRAQSQRLIQVQGWKSVLAKRLPLLGHRNWICVVDSAYPWQNSAGIELVDTGAEHVTVLKEVLKQLGKAPHVRPAIYLDRELDFVSESDAKGIDAIRKSLSAALPKGATKSMLHEEIIAKLGKAGSDFKVLMLKTNLTLPYTSVFMELGCAYWSDEAEKRMRLKMGGG